MRPAKQVGPAGREDDGDAGAGTTVGFVRFAVFLPKPVGGAAGIAAITRHEGFRRVRRKSVHPADPSQGG